MSEEAAYNFEHNIIILNIGGTEYTTLRSTLQKYQESLLGAMFETDYRFIPPLRDFNGRIFIDRDGPMFKYILNFLRTGRLCLPSDFKDFELLEAEADYFQIIPLISHVKRARITDPGVTPLHYIEITDYEENNYTNDLLAGSGLYSLSLATHDNSRDSISVSGPIKALLTLPLPDSIIKELNASSAQIYTTVRLNKGSVCRMAVTHHLQSEGWTLESTTCLNDSQHAYVIQKYIWTRPVSCIGVDKCNPYFGVSNY